MFVANLWQNLRYAIRALGRNPGSTMLESICRRGAYNHEVFALHRADPSL